MKNTFQSCSDIQLAATAVSGSRAAFEEIVRRHCRPISQFIAYKTKNLQDTEDLSQETFLRAYQNIDTFDTGNSLKNWLFTIAYHLVVSYYRRKKMPLAKEQELHDIPAAETRFYENADWLWKTVSEMEQDSQTVLWLHYKQDMILDDIAGIMKRSPAAVRVLLHRARKRLEKKLRGNARISEQIKIHFPEMSVMERTK
jgi:RNA polymerase sigma-70 factor (ECF subfamily)